MRPPIVTAVVVGLLTAAAPAPAPKENDPKKEVEKLQGSWRGVSIEKRRDRVNDDQMVLSFDKSSFTLTRDGKVLLQGTFTIDPSKKQKAIDMKVTEASVASYKGREVLGIYEVKGDVLRWCWTDPIIGPAAVLLRPRPPEFDPKDVSHSLFTFKMEAPSQ
jgi:uncharacterized protein (TIGR03067 family)